MELVALVAAHLVAALLAPSLCRRAKRHGPRALALVPLASAAWLASQVGVIARGEPPSLSLAWAPSLSLSFSLRLDALSLLFALLITGTGAVIVLYAGGYLARDERRDTFLALLLAFAGVMLGLILAGDLFTLYGFWEGTSVISFLLIGFDHEQEEAREAAWQALLVTVAGGLCLLGAAVLVQLSIGSASLAALATPPTGALLPGAVLALGLIAAFTKSAQLPFHFWLPRAMAAPTPVSAYLHSATMVNAGIYLLFRLWPAFGAQLAWQLVVGSVGAATMVVGAWLALVQRDAKRLLAYSTVSALGMMTLLLGLGTAGGVLAAAAFLLGHALYKGALFLFAGAIDHGAGSRRLDELSGLFRVMPWTCAAALIAAASMIGAPPTFGFVAKDDLLRQVLQAEDGFALATFTTVASAVYVAAALTLVLGPTFGPVSAKAREAHEVGVDMRVSLWALAFAGALLGPLSGWVSSVLLEPSARAVTGAAPRQPLALWHGLEPALGLGVLALAAGAALFPLVRRLSRLSCLKITRCRLSADTLYGALKDALFRFAGFQTGALQHGYLPLYVFVVVAAVGTLVAWPLLLEPTFVRHKELPALHELLLGCLIIASALGAALLRSRLASLACMSMVGFGVALVFLDQRAPELGITQFLVETLFVVLFLLALPHLPPFERRQRLRVSLLNGVLATAGGGVITLSLLAALAQEPPSFIPMAYVEASRGHNVVNSVLTDFRALDTLGEILVLTTAAVGVTILSRALRRRGGP